MENRRPLSLTDLSTQDRRLCERARDAALTAYAPYSGFAVGAAVRTSAGDIVTASNFENASYGLSICAEVVAVTAANASGSTGISAIAIVGYKYAPKHEVVGVVTPCGRCRQVLWEVQALSDAVITVICCNGDLTEIEIYSLEELLPHAFDVASLRRFPLKQRPKNDITTTNKSKIGVKTS